MSRPRWSRRAKYLWGVNAALAAGILGLGARSITHAPVTQTVSIERRVPSVEHTRTPAQERPHVVTISREPLHFSQIPKGNYCTMYARLVAEKLFGKKFNAGDAWDAAQRNRSVWKGDTTRVKDIFPVVKPGQIIGIYNPGSKFNSHERAYTHTALYVGFGEGKNWIMHRVGTHDRLESLEDFLQTHPGWKIKELIDTN